MFDIIIRNGMVCDGTGNPWTKLDIAVKDDRIVKISNLENESARLKLMLQDALCHQDLLTHIRIRIYCVHALMFIT